MRMVGFKSLIGILCLALLIAACGPRDTPILRPGRAGALSSEITLLGAGASFPAPLYQRWFSTIQAQYGSRIYYQSVGSGAGIQEFIAGLVDFGASDVAMTDQEIETADHNVIMVPITAGSVVIAYNLAGIPTGLKLARETYVNILLGNLQYWTDPAILKDNPDLNLPDLPITVIHRSEGSGMTGVLTHHLATISSIWSQQIGEGKTVQWLTGIGARGNEGVTAQLQQLEGSISYIGYDYAIQNDLTYAALENRSGQFMLPTPSSTAAALSAETLPDNLRLFIADPEGATAYPLVSYSWLLVHKYYDSMAKARAISALIDYGLNEGQAIAAELGYIPLPSGMLHQVADTVNTITPDYAVTLTDPSDLLVPAVVLDK